MGALERVVQSAQPMETAPVQTEHSRPEVVTPLKNALH